jgi:hypothetical protein
MYSFSDFPAINSWDQMAPPVMVVSGPVSSRQLSRDASLGSLVKQARLSRRKKVAARSAERQPVAFRPLLATR